MPTKAELLEQNTELLKNAIAGWANRMEFILNNIIEIRAEHLQPIIDEMYRFSGE